MRNALIVGALMILPVLVAGCTLPQQDDPLEDSLQPRFDGIPGLTTEARSHPVALHVTPDGRHAYVALAGTIARPDDRIAIVDLESGELERHVTVGSRPVAFAADPQDPHTLLVAHPYSPHITVLDTEDGIVANRIPAPYYLEGLAFSPDGTRLVATDRNEDRLVVYNVTRNDLGMELDLDRHIATGPNPEHVVFVPPPAGADWDASRLVAATARHGASVTLADLTTGATRHADTGGAPLALAARDGLLFVAGYHALNGTGIADGNETVETDTRSVDNSILLLDLRRGPAALTDGEPLQGHRYLSDTAREARGHSQLRILGGAAPRALIFANATPGDGDGQALWVAFHGSDQVQALTYASPGDGNLSADTAQSRSGAIGARLSSVTAGDPLVPGRLTDTQHGIFETRPGPRALARSGDILIVVAEFPEELQLIDLADCPGPEASTSPCTSTTIPLVDDPTPWPNGPFEEGERLFYSALPSADQDRACASCHIDGLSSGGEVRVPPRQVPVRIPRLDQMADNAPWLLDGTVRVPGDYLNSAGGDLLAADPGDSNNLANRDQFTPRPGDDPRFPGLRARLEALVPGVTTATDYLNRTFAYGMGEERILPAPPGTDDGGPNGARLFERPGAQCMSCHLDGTQANLLEGPQLEPVPRPPSADTIKAPALGGLWDREGVGYLYDGRAKTLHGALLPAGHPCLPGGADGLDRGWHGDLADRTCGSVDDLVAYLMAFEARR